MGILYFIGVVNNLAANNVAHFGENASNNLAVSRIGLGICNDWLLIGDFFVISINFVTNQKLKYFFFKFQHHKYTSKCKIKPE
ncbi:MAG: hypothetical protein C0525_06400 [Flavobacterium sp.]|nr:hypothetical protein [Flavobacterium sp.]